MTDQEILSAAAQYGYGWVVNGEMVPFKTEEDDGEHFLEMARALLSRAIPEGHVVVPGWLPIESAPKDGRRVLAWREHAVYPVIVGWDSDYEEWEDLYGDHIYHLTHWMPLPAAPANKEG